MENRKIMYEKTIPHAFHVMAKPTGARCNLDCAYCFFLKKEQLYPGGSFCMSDEVMETFIRQTIEAHQVPNVTIAWQGGEPTLMGIDFFKRAMAIEEKYKKPGMKIENTLQTNGILIDEQWCRFLHDFNFLVGVSIDGPRALHDVYRKNKAGKPVFDKVVKAIQFMQEYQVEFNVLCTINAANCNYPLEVYRFFRDLLKTPYVQFIPIVERETRTGNQEGSKITNRTVDSKQFGKFLIQIFDEWVRHDVGKMFVQFFDGVLASYVRGSSTLCIFQQSCGLGVALEHTGDLYSCDHYVEPDYLLGNIIKESLVELVAGVKQQQFGSLKSISLPNICRNCEFLFTCFGECPKNRILKARDGSGHINWLCAGLKSFFVHTRAPMIQMANLLRSGQCAEKIMETYCAKKGSGKLFKC
jgi:uncharacterized protein